jgi:hypothetical protein
MRQAALSGSYATYSCYCRCCFLMLLLLLLLPLLLLLLLHWPFSYGIGC